MTMKWLTREWASGSLGDDEWLERWQAYEAHREQVLPSLHSGAERLADGIDLHDAQVHTFDYRPGAALVMRAHIGHLQIGYELLELTFIDAELRLKHGASIESLRLFNAATEIVYDEIDLEPDGRFAHRILLSPAGEYEVAFTALTEWRAAADPRDRRFA
ncbi:hypothetical protein [Agromyces sp. NPDC058064]|uniref:hypothetical protein n=1 Tax=Agromyces sp. NPDC058064 TaxID=3346322 RepID=UPI0036DF1866